SRAASENPVTAGILSVEALDGDLIGPGEQSIRAVMVAQEIVDGWARVRLGRKIEAPGVVVPDHDAPGRQQTPDSERIRHDLVAPVTAVDVGEIELAPVRGELLERQMGAVLDF